MANPKVKVCLECGDEFIGQFAVYCSQSCQKRAYRRGVRIRHTRDCWAKMAFTGDCTCRPRGIAEWQEKIVKGSGVLNRPVVTYDRACEECGTPFTGHHVRATYCSNTCRSRAAQRRRRLMRNHQTETIQPHTDARARLRLELLHDKGYR